MSNSQVVSPDREPRTPAWRLLHRASHGWNLITAQASAGGPRDAVTLPGIGGVIPIFTPPVNSVQRLFCIPG